MSNRTETSTVDDVSLRAVRKARMSEARVREMVSGYLFASPWMLGFLLFTLGPLLASLYYSLNQYRLLQEPMWLGLGNYRTALTGDRLFWQSVERTLLWSITTVPLGVLGSLVAALLLNRGVRGTVFWRTCFFLPSLTPQVAAAILWVWIFQPDIGVLNSIIRLLLGIRGPRWLGSTKWAMPALIIVNLWSSIGSNRMLIFLAGLQGVPEELYDASVVDGANWWQKTLHVTIPLITPTIFFNMVLGIISSFQVFGMAFVATGGGPAYATYFYALHLYQIAFMSFDMGYGSALAWILFVALLLLTMVQIKLSGRWVYSAGRR